MSERQVFPGAQSQGDRLREQEAVRTTIVGGRPPGSGQSLSCIPRGLEVLLKKASVDPAFKILLLTRRGEAAQAIGLALEPSEVLMLQSAPAMHLETVIGQVRVPQEHRRAFLGQAAAAMLAALGVGLTQGCDRVPVEDGMRPEKPLVIPLEPLTPEKIEEHVKEVIANRFKVELDMVKPKAALLDLLHAGVGRVSDPPVVVAGEIARLPDDYHLLRLKRQLEKEYAIKLDGEDFFAKVKTVGDLVQAVQAAVKNRSQPSKEEPTPQRDRPISHGIRPIE